MEDNRDDQIQRALNEAKRRELEEKFGAQFSMDESKAPPEIQSQFLQHIEEYELKYQNAARVTVRQFVGPPTFMPFEEIPAGRLEEELDSALARLAEHSVLIDFLADVPLEERYRFVTGELLDKETDDIRIEGMRHHFVYEDFHPNDRYDATMFAGDFLLFLLDGDVRLAMNGFCKDELLDAAGKPTSPGVMENEMQQFTGRVMTFLEKHIEEADCSVDGDFATVTFDVTWDGLMAASLQRETFSGVATLRMKRSPYTGWDVVQAIVPGWNA